MELYLIVLIVLIYVGLIVLIAYKKRKRKDEPKEFDERQKLIHGNGFMLAFIITCAVLILFSIAIPEKWLDAMGKMKYWIPVVLGIQAYASYCIWKDALFQVNEKDKSWIVTTLILTIWYAFCGIHDLLNGDMIQDGKLQYGFWYLFLALMELIVLTEYLIWKRMSRRRSRDEESEA